MKHPSNTPRRNIGLAAVVLITTQTFAAPIDFSREIRPLLAKNCLACHGADKEARKAKLRLDTFEGATADLDGVRSLVPGKPDQSEMIYRIETDDSDDIMPPPKTGHVLTAKEKATLRQWVLEGGEYQAHWAFLPPVKGDLPKTKNTDWARKPLDHFVLAQLEANDLQPSPEADRIQWLRRVSLDLTGLPPSIADAEAFAKDRSPDAFEKVVDRLLASDSYGEHWARMWLDLARYADTKGYEKDQHRNIWQFREWVIRALNQDMPFDQFTIEQIAGDLLPNPTMEQQVATAFHRNTMTNDEGGTDNEEFRVAAVKDRVDTTLQVWMGLTMSCAKCHDHKYDPIKQKEYYQTFAFFNQTQDADHANDQPTLKVIPPGKAAEAEALKAQIAEQEKALAAAKQAATPELKTWLTEQRAKTSVWQTLAPSEANSAQGATLTIQPGHSILASGKSPATDTYTITGTLPAGSYTTLRIDALTHPSLNKRNGPGRNGGDPNFVLSELTIKKIPTQGDTQVLKIAAAKADFEQNSWPVKNAFDGNPKTGWAISPQQGKDHLAAFQLADTLEVKDGDRIRLTLSQQYGNSLTFGALRFAAGKPGAEKEPVPQLRLAQILAMSDEQALAPHRRGQLGEVQGNSQSGVASLSKEIEALKKSLAAIEKQATTVPVMRDLPANKQRKTQIHIRGNFLDPGDAIEPALPEAFGQLPKGAPTNRLGVAQWLVTPENPLTARVMVNRVWARLFGIGLVETEEDFGIQGLFPSHPELLDWLAVDFRDDQAWSLKQLLRSIVLSSTYRQDSRSSEAQLAADPRNRLLGRGPRFRLSAETLRDQALAVSGLLTHKIGGPSVMPPQPAGVWKTTYNGGDWKNATGPDRYRRGVYTYLKRTSPYPAMVTFDAGSGEVCQIRRIRTNTPLQALVTLNDPAFVEAAGALAKHMEQHDTALEKQIHFGFKRVLLRDPSAKELKRLIALYRSLENDIADGSAFLSAADRKEGDPALIGVANVLLNLDETIMKP